jgi:uncharacterized protein YmfQ (DUF2313 family)
MAIAAEAFARMLKALLPRGVLWRLEQGSAISNLLLGVSDELARIDARGENLIDEIHAPSTFELLADFERVYGLPDPCLGEDQSTSQRIASVVQRITAIGGQTAAYYIGIAAAIGFTITITEFKAHDVDDDVEYSLLSEAWNFAWQVNAPLNTVGELTVEETVDDALAWFGNEQLECVLEELKPAHTEIIFAYA